MCQQLKMKALSPACVAGLACIAVLRQCADTSRHTMAPEVVVTFVLTVLCIGSALIVARRARGGLLDFLGCVTGVSLMYAVWSRSRLKRA